MLPTKNRLSQLMKSLRKSQKEIADECGVSSSTISRCATGEIAISDKIARTLYNNYGINPEWLNGENVGMKEPLEDIILPTDTAADRIRYIIAMEGISIRKLATFSGLPISSLLRQLTSGNIPVHVAEAISDTYPKYPPEWIMFGGDTLDCSDSVNNTDTTDEPNNSDGVTTPPNPSGVPLFSSLQMGCGMFKGGELSAVKGLENGYISLPKSLFPTRDGDLFVIANGRSMIDNAHEERSIADGSIVCLRRCTESYIRWGEIYAVSTNDGFVIKRLYQSDNDDCIRCVSSNTEEKYEPFDIPKCEIQGIALVIGVINIKAFA